ncbi:amidohydrolase family protein [Rhodococcus sp. JS3073]|uniref:amidohydrolase family protein n=1 Tax=Rhodococcus sp. JS3073 TaxID=3002901 RepID=UPI002285A372|nr:amidohydrolase family protein [Rhodococcus sp. JS3073]WAM18976.1 amidohydrolase family protein [Rhodococcus sp. JS3073]
MTAASGHPSSIRADLLLEHGVVVTMDPQRRIIEDGAVAVVGDRIAAIGTTTDLRRDYTTAETIDCAGQIVLPGLVDAHGHGGHALLKTIGVDTLSWWMRIATRTYFEHTSSEFWHADGQLAALERLKFGVTCGVSVLGSQPRSDVPEFGAAHARAYAEVGLRAVLGVGPCGLPWPREVGYWVGDEHRRTTVCLNEMMAGAEATVREWHGGADGRIRVYVTPYTMVPSLNPGGPTAPDLATELTAEDLEQTERVRDLAARYSTRIHTDAFGGMIELAHRRDPNALLGPDVHFQHGFGLSRREVAILAETGTGVTHGPGVVVGALRGRCPVPELLDAGVTVAVTTDGCAPMSSFDLFTAMRQAQTLSQLQLRDVSVLPPGKLLEMVTIDAARALGWDDEIGSLEPGKAADMIVVDTRQPHLQPVHMPVHTLVYKASGQDVGTVVVAGRVLMRDRVLQQLDEAQLVEHAVDESRRVVARGGLERFITLPAWGTSRQVFDHPVPFGQ